MNYEVCHSETGKPIKAWTQGVPVEEAARKQLLNLSELPFIYSHVAAMPDVHWGMGATVGSVIATDGAIIPAAVGVDIGCGMMAVRLDGARAEHLPASLARIRSEIERAVPTGFEKHAPAQQNEQAAAELFSSFKWLEAKHPNPESFHSCSHGAGRTMSRTAAKKRFTLQDHAAATRGVECRKDAGVIDETPAAYKDIDAVMAAQSDLVEIVHTLKQVICVKG